MANVISRTRRRRGKAAAKRLGGAARRLADVRAQERRRAVPGTQDWRRARESSTGLWRAGIGIRGAGGTVTEPATPTAAELAGGAELLVRQAERVLAVAEDPTGRDVAETELRAALELQTR